MDLMDTHEAVDHAVRLMDDLANQRIAELGNSPAGLRERASRSVAAMMRETTTDA